MPKTVLGYLDPQSESEMTHPEMAWQFQGTIAIKL